MKDESQIPSATIKGPDGKPLVITSEAPILDSKQKEIIEFPKFMQRDNMMCVAGTSMAKPPS